MPPAAPGHARAYYRLALPGHTRESAAPIYLGTPIGLTPANVHTLYDFPAVTSSSGGKGQTIALIEAYDDPNIEADLAIFDMQFGLPACTHMNGCFKKISATGVVPKVNAGWSLETSLDVEWAHAIAPQANILLVEAASDSLTDLLRAVVVAAEQKANVISMSWGVPEFSAETEIDSIFQAFSSIALVAASGDGGFGVVYPAASPYVLAVGGTTIEVGYSKQGVGHRLGETAWSASSGGISQFEPPSLAQSVFLTAFPSRAVPDIAYLADPYTGLAVFDSMPYQGYYGWLQVGGTSAGAPQWSALIAVASSSVGHAINTAQAGYALYSSLGSASLPLFDITIGTNGLCGTACLASSGYDLVTGLGTPKASAVIATLGSAGSM